VAMAARAAGCPATLVMPSDAPRSKVEATRAQGAKIVIYDRFKEDREAIGARISAETGATLAPPFNHPWIIAGQGTTALELLQQVPDLDAIVTPIGGGGLISIEVKRTEPAAVPQPSEPTDMIRLDFPCHPAEPVKVPDDWTGEVACMVCGVRYPIGLVRSEP